MRDRRSAGDAAEGHDRGSLLDALRGVRWPARRAAAGVLPGAHQSRLRGAAPELSEYRLYRQGDEPRRIDWRLLARSDRAYIRLAEDRSIVTTVLIVDATASMAYPPRTLAKWRTACDVAVGLAAVAHASRDPVGVVIAAGDGVRQVPPRTRRGAVGEIARALDSASPGGRVSIAAALARIHGRSRIVILSDFLDDADGLRRRAVEVAAAGGEVHAVHIVADEELDPPARAMLAVDPEDPTVARPLAGESRAGYLTRFGVWREGLAAKWRGEGLSYTLAVASEPGARIVRRVVGARAAGAAGIDRRDR